METDHPEKERGGRLAYAAAGLFILAMLPLLATPVLPLIDFYNHLARFFVLSRIGASHPRARYVGRAASASPATGLASRHKAEQEALVNEAITVGG